MSDNIHVAVRMRPLISREIENKAAIHWNAQKFSTICQSNSPTVAFHFDRVFQGHENNEVVYAEFCSPIVKSVIDGFNGTIFAYGQTSSGKTFTMMGDDDGKSLGVIHHTITDIFTFIQDMPEREFLLRVSYMEIYNEMVRDLLSDKNDKNENLKLHEDQYGLIKVNGLSEHIVQEADQVLTLMRQAERKRRTGETRMNEKSSRSHSIFRMIIESGLKGEADAAVNVSQFNLVDLAGSERASQTGAKGARFKESININKSLLMLSQVISQLSEKVLNDQFINYRDSKLTRILQNSLGGNARTAIICTVTPACLDETLSTLKFAERAKNIRNKPEVNEVLTEQALLKQYANKIKKLTKELEATKEEKAQQNKSLQEQIQNLKKSYVFQIPLGIKSRSNRRETWGGCLDAARLRLDTLPPRKPLTSADMSLEDELLKPRTCVTPQRKWMPAFEERSSMPCALRNRFHSSDLPTLEEERDTEVDTFVEDDDTFAQSSKLYPRQRCSVPSQSETTFQTDLESSNLSTLHSEQILKLKERILFLEKELAELIDVTTLERQIFRSKTRNSLDSKNRLSLDRDVSGINQSELLSITQEVPMNADETKIPVSTGDCVFETENIDTEEALHSKSMLPDVKIQSTLQEFNKDYDELYDYLGSTIKMLGVRKNIDQVSEKDNLNSHYKVMLDMFNLIMQYQCLTFKGSFKTDLAEKISKISFNLAHIFENFSADSTPEDSTEDLIENFMTETDGILKEIEMFSLDADDEKHGILNQSLYNESFLQRHSFEDSVINVSNVKSPRFAPLKTITEDSINTSNELLSTTVDADAALQFTNEDALRECISTLEKDIEMYRKSILDLQCESELKDKQVSIFKDKLEIQEKIIDGLKDELTVMSYEVSNCVAMATVTDSSSQTLEESPSENLSVDCSSQTIEEMPNQCPVSDGCSQTCNATHTDNYSQTGELSNVAAITFVDDYTQTLDEKCSGIDNHSQTDSVCILSNDIVFSSSSCQTSEDFLHLLPNKNKILYTDGSSQTADIDIQPHSPKVLTEVLPLTSDSSFAILQNSNAADNLLEELDIEESNSNLKDAASTEPNTPKTKAELENQIIIGDGDSRTEDNRESCEEIARIVKNYEKQIEETRLEVDANLQVTLNDLLELRIFALEFMKREMKKFLGDVEFLENNASSPILDQIKIEITALKELLVRLEFYIKNQNKHKEYFNEVLEKNMLENGLLKEQLEQVEFSLKEKDAEQMNISKLLLDVDSSISELMQNVKASDSVGRTSYVDCEAIKYPISDKIKPARYIKLLQKKILSLGTLIHKNTSLVTDLSAKLQETEDKLKCKNLEEKEQQSLKLTKNVQTIEDNRLLEMSRKLEEAEVCLEDLKREINSLTHKLETMNEEKKILENKFQESNSTIEKLTKDFEIERLNWSDNTIECVKKVEEKCDQMMIEQENKFFDDIDKLKQEHRAQLLKRNENYKVEQEQWLCEIEETRKKHQASLNEARDKLNKEISDRYDERFRLEAEISDLKEKIHNITQLNACMKDKYKRYSAQMQQKLKVIKSVQEKQTQTDLLQSNESEIVHTKSATNHPIHASQGINFDFEECSNCKALMQKISDFKNSKQNENPDVAKEIEINKRLKKELCDVKNDMLSAKSNNTNLIKENVSLKQELSSKLVLLRSCHCRLNPNPSSAVKEAAKHLDQLEASAQKKRKLTYEDNQKEAKSSDLRKEILTIDPADILKNEIVQRAIQEEAKSLQMVALSNGSGPDGIMKCAYLTQKLKKKDRELEKKNKELEMMKKELANNAYSSKRHAVETMENQPVKAVEDKKSVRPFHPFPQGAVPQLQPKKILKEINRIDPTSNHDYAVKEPTPKKSNMGDIVQNRATGTDFLKMNKNNENKSKDREYEKRRQIEKLTGEVPECKQQ